MADISSSTTTIATDIVTSSSSISTSVASATGSESDSGTTTTAVPSTPTTTITAASSPSFLLGPLTTTFTTPTHCDQAYWVSATNQIYDPTLGQACASVDGGFDYIQNNNCLPPVTKSTIIGILNGNSSTSLSTSYDYIGYYSPGVACPSGYTTACAAQAGANGIQSVLPNFQSFDFVYTATAYETVAGCCPTGFQCENVASSQWCQKVVASTTQPVITCMNSTNSVSASTTQFTLPTVVTLSATETLISGVVTSTFNLTTLSLLATMVQINFQASDISSTSSQSASPLSSSVSQPATTSAPSSNSSHKHKTAIITVAVIIPCVIALIAAGLGWFWYRQRKNKQLTASYQSAQSTEPSEMYKDYCGSTVPIEVSGDPARFEFAGTVPQYEMTSSDPNTVVHEMYAGNEFPTQSHH